MTEQLYLHDSYRKEFEATVVSINGNDIVLDQTCFYPSGGGQPTDTGTISAESGTYKVISVKKAEQGIVHTLDREGLKPQDKIKGTIDWERRYKLMRSHTATHVLISVVCSETGALITGNQIDLDKTRIDLNLESFNNAAIQRYVDKANELIQQDIPVTIAFTTREQALHDQSLFKLMKGFPEHIKNIRIVTIGTIDKQADGGTHVRSTKEIGAIELLERENKGKNNRRVYFRIV